MDPNLPELYRMLMDAPPKHRFHTPGHGGRNLDGSLYTAAGFDLTELSFSDNLQMPEGVIARAEQRAATVYGADACLFFTAGATTAVFTAMFCLAEKTDTIAVWKDAHKSVYTGTRLAGLQTVTLQEERELAQWVKSGGKAVVVTSPDYYGRVVPAQWLKELQKAGVFLVLDASHGSHFAFSPLFEKTAAKGADLTIYSLHKTLPVFTGGAMLAAKEAFVAAARDHRQQLHTTSPSYLTLGSIDYALHVLGQNGEKLYADLSDRVQALKRVLANNGLFCLENGDFTRLVIDCGNAEAVAKQLEKKGIFAEMHEGRYLVLIVTPWNAESLAALQDALLAVKRKAEAEPTVWHPSNTRTVKRGTEWVAPRAAAGRFLSSEISIYPPGTPVAKRGDLVDDALIDLLERNIHRITGLRAGMLPVEEES